MIQVIQNTKPRVLLILLTLVCYNPAIGSDELVKKNFEANPKPSSEEMQKLLEIYTKQVLKEKEVAFKDAKNGKICSSKAILHLHDQPLYAICLYDCLDKKQYGYLTLRLYGCPNFIAKKKLLEFDPGRFPGKIGVLLGETNEVNTK